MSKKDIVKDNIWCYSPEGVMKVKKDLNVPPLLGDEVNCVQWWSLYCFYKYNKLIVTTIGRDLLC